MTKLKRSTERWSVKFFGRHSRTKIVKNYDKAGRLTSKVKVTIYTTPQKQAKSGD